MNEENVKIAKIKKSSHIGKILATVLSIAAIVGCAACIAGSIYIFSLGRGFDDMINEGIAKGIVTTEEMDTAAVKLVNINVGKADSIHSDIPELQEAIDDHPYAFKFGMTCAGGAALMAVVAVMMKLVGSVFALIETEDSPFTDKIIKRVTLVLAVTSGLLFFTSGMAYGVLAALVTWVVYTVMDYGKTLQIQADETL